MNNQAILFLNHKIIVLLSNPRLLIFFVGYLFIPTSSFAYTDNAPPTLQSAFEQIINSEEHHYLKKNEFLIHKEALNNLYLSSPTPLLWLNPSPFDNQNIIDVLLLISHADKNGLSEKHYNFSLLQKKWQSLKHQTIVTINDQILLDTAISISLLHFLSDIQFGQIDPRSLDFHFQNNKDPSLFIPLILEAIKKNTVNELSKKVEPTFPMYHQLKKALSRYRNKQRQPLAQDIQYSSTIRPNDNRPEIITIKKRLDFLDVVHEETVELSPIYDKNLIIAIKEFQSRHGLQKDGIIGKKTIDALNSPLSDYVQKIEFAMERIRWLPPIPSGPLVFVNIPAFQLWAYHTDKENNEKPLNMRVIVGKSVKNESPVFTANIRYLDFAPYWNIPKSITFKEIIPKIQKNPRYLQNHQMELVRGFGNNVRAVAYPENLIEQLKNRTLKLRQRPGKRNALGRVKFIFPNNHNVYLHDTPSRNLFKRTKRDFSHGCIRVEKPNELAKFLLQTKSPLWNQKKIKRAMTLRKPKRVHLNKTIPVVIFYSTAQVLDDKLFFYDDIYGYDTKLAQAFISHRE